MGLIEDFVARYRKEYDYYDQVARLVAQMLDVNLQAAGIRSMVTARAKNVSRLESKIRQRAVVKNYASVESVLDDIVDLAGVRVALYFPGEREQVDTLVRNLFSVISAKGFPEAPKPTNQSATPSYEKRFSGYWAKHYRVQMKEASLSEAQKRYSEGRVEIQVASVLMHAWAEVEHDLVYKPQEGVLSTEELSILDELNGLALRFAEEQLPHRYASVEACFHHQGAYARFKELLAAERCLEKWYAFKAESTARALREWCNANDIQLAEAGSW